MRAEGEERRSCNGGRASACPQSAKVLRMRPRTTHSQPVNAVTQASPSLVRSIPSGRLTAARGGNSWKSTRRVSGAGRSVRVRLVSRARAWCWHSACWCSTGSGPGSVRRESTPHRATTRRHTRASTSSRHILRSAPTTGGPTMFRPAQSPLSLYPQPSPRLPSPRSVTCRRPRRRKPHRLHLRLQLHLRPRQRPPRCLPVAPRQRTGVRLHFLILRPTPRRASHFSARGTRSAIRP